MARFTKYAVARFSSHPVRDERLNIALVIFNNDGLDIRMGKRLDKVRAISGSVDTSELRERFGNLVELDRTLIEGGDDSPESRWQLLMDLGLADLSILHELDCSTKVVYENSVDLLMKGLIEPEPTQVKIVQKRSHLLSTVKLALRREGILARPGDDISDHRVVSNVPLAEGLTADLVLKNGSMHVVETIDASSPELTARKIVTDIALSALVLEQARISFGDQHTQANLVYNASAATEAVAMPSLKAAAHQGANLVNWESQDDQKRFLTHLASLAVPYERKHQSLNHSYLTTSQGRLKLN